MSNDSQNSTAVDSSKQRTIRGDSKKALQIFGTVLFVFGLLLTSYAVHSKDLSLALLGAALALIGVPMYFGIFVKKVSKEGVEFQNRPFDISNTTGTLTKVGLDEIQAPKLTKEQERERRGFSEGLNLPGREAPKFDLLEHSLTLTATPVADPMTPMYILDAEYRIMEWNDAFSLAFDRSMEGRRGESVLEWVYFLENYQDVLQHGVQAFADPDNLPRIDVEKIRFNGKRYGRLSATKRAYQIPGDDGGCIGWLITVEPEFETSDIKSAYYSDLIYSLRQSLMWTEYALSYDTVLNNTQVYPELLDTLIGTSNPDLGVPAIDAKVLDLGAGTGNITQRLAETGRDRLVVALDNNPMMLNILRSKCQNYLRSVANGPGVIATRQDITLLFGLKEGYFDVAFLNNVLYTLNDEQARQCLGEVFRVLKPGGEVRISGPKRDADLHALFERIKSDLEKSGQFIDLQEAYWHVREINYSFLQPMLNKWDAHEIIAMLEDCGLKEVTHINEEAYAGQSRIVCARKPREGYGD